ncbi:MAG: glucuronokinase [Planctomycetota bacterium]|jgi:glucuronokinase
MDPEFAPIPSPAGGPTRSHSPEELGHGGTRGIALGRVGLLGNPSDGYGGKVLSFTFLDQQAEVRVAPSERARVTGPNGEALEAASLDALLPRLLDPSLPPGADLILGAWGRFRRHAEEQGSPLAGAAGVLRVAATTTIPRQVGLSGSSALVIASLRAFGAHFQVGISPIALAAMALAVEVDDLGLSAGPQDRVVQSFEGLVSMDFSGPHREEAYVPLEPFLLPALFIAWTPKTGVPSSTAHREVRERWDRGDPEVRQAISAFAPLAVAGVEALERGDAKALADLLDQNFAARRAIWPLAQSDLDLVALAHKHNTGAKLAGSGGAIVGVLRDNDSERLTHIAAAYRSAGYAFLVPKVGRQESNSRDTDHGQ